MTFGEFADYVEKTLIPQMKEFGIVSATVKTAVGDKAVVSVDKHGFYKIKYMYEKNA